MATLSPVEIQQTGLRGGGGAFLESGYVEEQISFKLHVGIAYVPRRWLLTVLSVYTTLGNWPSLFVSFPIYSCQGP